MNYIAPRNMTVSSLSGRSVIFAKGIPTYAPPQMHAELIAMGVVPAEAMDEPEPSTVPAAPSVPHEREAAIFAAYEKVALRNSRNEFTANGSPHLAVMSKELGWNLDGKERDSSWQKFNNREKQ